MIYLPTKPEVLTWKQRATRRLQLPERLGYAHTLALELLEDALFYHEWKEMLTEAAKSCALQKELREAIQEVEREKWKRYDRVTHFLFEHTAMY